MTNRKWIGMIAVGAVLGILAATPSFAATVNEGDWVTITWANPYGGNGSGGAFGILKNNVVLFNTFCLETDEYFNPGKSYYVYDISNIAYAGGANTDSGDNLDFSTAFLYRQYLDGIITDQKLLQNAIWVIEQEITSNDLGVNKLINSAANASGYYGVAVMNISSDEAGRYLKQSMLVPVPEPGTLVLLGSGMVGMWFAKRRRVK